MDSQFELHSTTFDFIPITGHHTGENLGELLFASFKKAGTLEKVGNQLPKCSQMSTSLFVSHLASPQVMVPTTRQVREAQGSCIC